MPNPFEDDDTRPSVQSQKIGLKKVSSKESIFDSMPKKPTAADLEQKVQKVHDRSSVNKSKTADLAIQFNKTMADKTLTINKNMFQKEMELDLLRNMVKLAQEINSDGNEREGEGSLSWITILLRTCLTQRDKINDLEYAVSQLEKKSSPTYLEDFVSKEISKALDDKKKSE
jgi:hypothetical protein